MESSCRIQGIPLGTAEFFGAQANLRSGVIGIIRGIYQEFGFDPLITPVLENAEVFSGHHGEGEELLFRLHDRGGTSWYLGMI